MVKVLRQKHIRLNEQIKDVLLPALRMKEIKTTRQKRYLAIKPKKAFSFPKSLTLRDFSVSLHLTSISLPLLTSFATLQLKNFLFDCALQISSLKRRNIWPTSNKERNLKNEKRNRLGTNLLINF